MVCLLVVLASIVWLARNVDAAGFQVNEQSARGLGSAFAGDAAAAEDASTIFFNPAGMTRLSGTQFVSSGFVIKPTGNFHNEGSRLNSAVGGICQLNAPRLGLPPQACVSVSGLRPQRVDGFTAFRGDDWNASYNVGVLLSPLDATRIGLAYRAYTHHRLGGSASFLIPKKAAILQRLSGALVDTDGNAALDLPDRVALSGFHQLTARWALLSDITWTRWSQFDQLVFNFENPKQPTIVQPERWKDSFRYSVGTRYEPTRQWSFRLGAAYDETPIPDDAHRTARIPDADRIWASFGIGFRFSDRMRFDFGYAHLFALAASARNPDPISDNVQVGSYSTHADIVGIGLHYDLGWPPSGPLL